MKIDELLKALYDGICVISYKKIEGPETGKLRKMVCTLSAGEIPSHTHIKQNPGTEHLLVWCIDRENWRSVRVSTIKEWDKQI